jgi:cation transport ATPase
MMADENRRKVIPVTRMDCPTCVATIEKELSRLEGVKNTRVNFLMKKIIVDYNPSKIDVSELEKKVEDLGYNISYKRYDSLLNRISKALRIRGEEEKGFKRVDDHNFEELVLRSTAPIIVLFSSSQCPTCVLMRKNLVEVEKKFKDKIFIYELDIMRSRIWEKYNVVSVPTLLYFKAGMVLGRLLGLANADAVEMELLQLTQKK